MTKNRSDQKILICQRSEKLAGILGPDKKFCIPGDKSISHRAALFGAIATGVSHFQNFQNSGVTLALLNALKKFGVVWELKRDLLVTEGRGLQAFNTPNSPVHCGNSGTTIRLLAGAVVASGVEATLDGSDGLRRRPMGRIIEPLQLMGAYIDSSNGCAPLEIKSSDLPLKSMDYTMPVASAQVKSCLMLASLSCSDETIIREPGPSRDHSERLLSAMGVRIISTIDKRADDEGNSPSRKGRVVRVSGFFGRNLSPLQLKIPGDISAASFVIVAGLIVPESDILIKGIGVNETRTGLIDALRMMGAQITLLNLHTSGGEPVADIHVQSSTLKGIKVQGDLVVRMIDEFPIFSIAAACAQGVTIVKDAAELRYKESDRIQAIVTELSKLGVHVSENVDGFQIIGKAKINGGIIDPHGDHRLAMALAIAGLVSIDPVIVQNAQFIQESFPSFIKLLRHLNANIESKDIS